MAKQPKQPRLKFPRKPKASPYKLDQQKWDDDNLYAARVYLANPMRYPGMQEYARLTLKRLGVEQ